MKYTENYHLPQWDETDRIMRTDFNAAMADIEAGLEKTAADAAELDAKAAADAAAADAKNAAAAQKAQSTADRAVADAAKAQAKADAAYAPDQPPYVVGTYRGNGGRVDVQLGFRPKFVIAASGSATDSFACAAWPVASVHLWLTESGFSAAPVIDVMNGISTEFTPYMSKENVTYSYIAFR